MLADRDAVEAADLQRRRVVSAFTTGDASDPVVLARRPNRAAWGGVALTVLAFLGTAVGTLLTDHVPKDWAAQGNVVVREATGARYLSDGGRLKPVRNDTSLALAGLPRPRTVRVDEQRFQTLPVGAPVGIAGAPARTPTVPQDDAAWTACYRPGSALALLTAGGATGTGRALLASTGDPGTLVLVADGTAHPVDPPVALALGYDPRAARRLTAAFAALLPTGRRLARLPRPAPAPASVPAKATPAVAAAPRPAYLAPGTLVQDTGDETLYVADAGQFRPVSGTTALRLLYGGPPPAPVRLPANDVRAVPAGPPLVVPGFPATPPPATGTGTWVCVSSAGGVLAEETELPVLGLTRGAAPAPNAPSVWQPDGVASLVRPAASLRAAVSPADPLLLVTGGRGYPLPDEAALTLLGYRDGQVRGRPAAWLRLVPPGPDLVPLARFGAPVNPPG